MTAPPHSREPTQGRMRFRSLGGCACPWATTEQRHRQAALSTRPQHVRWRQSVPDPRRPSDRHGDAIATGASITHSTAAVRLTHMCGCPNRTRSLTPHLVLLRTRSGNQNLGSCASNSASVSTESGYRVTTTGESVMAEKPQETEGVLKGGKRSPLRRTTSSHRGCGEWYARQRGPRRRGRGKPATPSPFVATTIRSSRWSRARADERLRVRTPYLAFGHVIRVGGGLLLETGGGEKEGPQASHEPQVNGAD